MDGQRAYLYSQMVADFPHMRCWLCGVDMTSQIRRPAWWHGAPWILHRAHLVASPRREDRRAVVFLCPVCHGLHHGERFAALKNAPRPTLAELLWLKRHHDPAWYDREWLQAHSTRRLPRAKKPRTIFAELARRGFRENT